MPHGGRSKAGKAASLGLRKRCMHEQGLYPACCRREEKQEAKRAEAFEAACQAKALVKTWKKPRLSAGQTSLPAELWGLVLEQLLPEACLWDLPATVQGLCNVSLTSKGLYSAVQQQGWPKLCQLLKHLRPPAAMRGGGYTPKAGETCQLPDNLDVLGINPTSLSVPQLRASCAYHMLTSSGKLHAAIPCCMQAQHHLASLRQL